MSLKENFGKRLKDIRNKRKMSQQEFAEYVDLQPNFIGQVEIGRRGISFTTLEKIANKLGISYCDFFDFDEVPSGNHLVNSIIRELDGMDEKFLVYVFNTIRELKKLIK